MTISIYSFAMALTWSSVFSIVFFLSRKNSDFICRFGISYMILLVLGFGSRILVPLELSFTKEIGLYGVFAEINQIVKSSISQNIQISYIQVFLFVWVTISLVLIFRIVIKHISFTYKIRKLDNCITSQIVECQNKMKKEIEGINTDIICSSQIEVPMCTGLIKKVILLPKRKYNDDDLMYILRHEYIHFKNKDIYVKLIIEMFIAIFWWNPFMHLLKRNLNHILEIKCDLVVVADKSQKEKKLI